MTAKGISQDVLEKARAQRAAGVNRLGRRPKRGERVIHVNAYPKASTVLNLEQLGLSVGEILDRVANCLSGNAEWESSFSGVDTKKAS